jgi:hypothetical protein
MAMPSGSVYWLRSPVYVFVNSTWSAEPGGKWMYFSKANSYGAH